MSIAVNKTSISAEYTNVQGNVFVSASVRVSHLGTATRVSEASISISHHPSLASAIMASTACGTQQQFLYILARTWPRSYTFLSYTAAAVGGHTHNYFSLPITTCSPSSYNSSSSSAIYIYFPSFLPPMRHVLHALRLISLEPTARARPLFRRTTAVVGQVIAEKTDDGFVVQKIISLTNTVYFCRH